MATYQFKNPNIANGIVTVTEGQSVYLDFVTTGVPEGTMVNFDFSGSISDADTVPYGLGSKSFAMGPNGFINIGWTFFNDGNPEGMESLIVKSVEDPSQVVTINVNDSTTAAITQPPAAGTGTATNNPPTGNVVIDGFAGAGVTLTANASSLSDPEGINWGTMQYQWFLDNSPVFMGQSYVLPEGNVGKTLTVQAKFVDNLGHNESVMSNNVIVQPTNSTTTQPPVAATGTYSLFVDKPNVTEGQIVNLTVQSSTNFALPNETVTVNWMGNGSISQADFNGGNLPTPLVINVGADGKGQMSIGFQNDNLKEGTESVVFALANNPSQSVTVSVNDLVMANNPAMGELKIDGQPKIGSMLSVNTSNLFDQDGGIDFNSFNYKWMYGDGTFLGNGNSYTVTNNDAGRNIQVKATFKDMQGNDEAKTSSMIAVQQAATYNFYADKPNVNEGETTNLILQTQNVSAGTAVNFTFGGTATLADVQGNFISPSFFVNADGKTSIPLTFLNDKMKEGMENMTFILVNDPSKSVTVNINDGIIPNTPPTGNVLLNGDAKVGKTLFADVSSVQDVDGLGTFNYQWLSNGAIINGKNGKDYTLINEDANKNISVQINYTDGQGNPEKLSSSPLFVQAAPQASYSLFADKPNVNEGETVNLILQTQNVSAGTAVNFTFGGTATLADVQGNFISPSFFVNADGKTSIPLTFLNDKMKEGMENMTFTLVNDPSKSVTVNINDGIVANTPPTGNVLLNGDAKVGKTLFADASSVQDADGLGTFNYQWFSNGAIINGKNGKDYTLVNEDANKNISVQVSYTDGKGTSEKLFSPTLFVSSTTSTPPEQKPTYSLSVDRTDAKEGESVYFKINTTNVPANSEIDFPLTFSGSITNADVEKEMLSPKRVWIGEDKVGTVAVSFLTDALKEGKEVLIATLNNDPNQSVIVSVNDNDATEPSPNPDGVNNPPTGEVVVSGNPKVGNVLKALNTLKDLDGMGAISYQWLRNDLPITGATKDSYTLREADLGKKISVSASYTDKLKNAESMTSDSTALVETANPTYALSVNKTTVNEGDVVDFTLETTDVEKGTIVSFNFEGDISDDDVVGGLPEAQFVVGTEGKATLSIAFAEDKSTDEGEEDLTLTLAEDSEQSVSVLVNDTSFKDLVNHKPTGSVKIAGTAKVGTTLTITNTLKDADGLGDFSYQWFANGAEIKNAVKSTYTVAAKDVNKKISVSVSYVDGLEFEESKISAETVAVKASVVTNIKKTGDSGNNKLVGAEKNDVLSGLAGNDTLLGNAGNDVLDGGTGNDSIEAGNGNDELAGGDGKDTLIGGSGNDLLEGDKDDDKLQGDAGKDTLNGGSGIDDMAGGAGDDYYFVDNAKDVVTEAKSAGADTVETTLLSYTLSANVENLLLAGVSDSKGTGNALDNTITGNLGDNVLNGGAGNDKLVGGAGVDTLDGGAGMDTLIGGDDDDIYFMNNENDKIVETEKGGEEDEIIASVNFELSDSFIEILTLSGAKAKEATGSENNDVLREADNGKVANTFNGKGGNDTINAEGGNDTIEGGAGDDEIDGGEGKDTVIFTGAETDYQIIRNPDADGVDQIIVEYAGTDPEIQDGKDILTNVEILQFSDGETMNVRDIEVTETSSNALILVGVETLL